MGYIGGPVVEGGSFTAVQEACSASARPIFLGLAPAARGLPFPRGWCHVLWGSTCLPSCPLKLVQSLLHCLVLAHRGRRLVPLCSSDLSRRGLVVVDAPFDVDAFEIGLWGPGSGGRVFHCSAEVQTQ